MTRQELRNIIKNITEEEYTTLLFNRYPELKEVGKNSVIIDNYVLKVYNRNGIFLPESPNDDQHYTPIFYFEPPEPTPQRKGKVGRPRTKDRLNHPAFYITSRMRLEQDKFIRVRTATEFEKDIGKISRRNITLAFEQNRRPWWLADNEEPVKMGSIWLVFTVRKGEDQNADTYKA